MTRYVLQDKSIRGVKKLLPKYSSTNIDTARVKGVIEVIGYRKYTWGEEIDIQFTGKIAAKIDFSDELTWWDSSILTEEVSLIKINKLIRRACFNIISERMNYFNIKIIGYSSIKKVKWL
jgi:hypothetical protein